MSGGFQAFWGKAMPAADAVSAAHPVVAHSLDVAAVAVLIGDATLDRRMLGWLVSLHDIGKFSRTFQAKAPRRWPASVLGVLDAADLPPPAPRHDALGLHVLKECLPEIVEPLLPPGSEGARGWLHGDRERLFRAVAGHHGRPVGATHVSPRAFCPGCQAAARGFADAMMSVFDPPPLAAMDPRAVARLEWSLAGLTTLADWIGSRQAWFPYVGEDAVSDPAAYFWNRVSRGHGDEPPSAQWFPRS